MQKIRKNIFLSFVGVAVLLALSFFGVPAPDTHAALSKRIFLTSGTSWSVPSDWSDTNIIEVIGAGGSGANGVTTTAGGGGGGGAYAKRSNIPSLSGSITVQVGAVKDTMFNTDATTCSALGSTVVCAAKGGNASGGTGGSAGSTATGDSSNAGGAGGSGSGDGGGGGGAGGPNGTGAAGDTLSGGQGDGTAGGAGGSAGFNECFSLPTDGGNGGNGDPGYEYDITPGHGSGGGGGGGGQGDVGFTGGTGGTGGNYGSGGGGGAGRCGGSGFPGGLGSGTQGLIIITYTSTETGSSSLAKFKIKGGRFLIRGGRVQIR
ncbi:MAG: hypothetical protein V4449_04240 [Patescibacteria group bacterium]